MRNALQRLWLVVALAFGLGATAVEAQFQINEDFVTVAPPGWVVINHSAPVGSTDWYQGDDLTFQAQGGLANSYAAANYNNTGNTGTISDWLLTPQATFVNGTILTFYTRKVAPDTYADRMQVRLSTNGASTDVGTLATQVGDFTTLLLEINPTLVLGVYPVAWTQYTVTLSGLPAGINTGRIAFRYFVTNAGFSGTNSDYIGVDTVTLTDIVPVDLSITKTDGQATAVPGSPVLYTIVASNAGPNPVTGATVADPVPPAIVGAAWTCSGAGGGTCAAGGPGNINDSTVNLPVGGSVTYMLMGTISASATGSLSNTATVTAPGGVTDTTPANNSATDTDILLPQADLSITKTDGQANAVPGSLIIYTIVASNAGPSAAAGATVVDPVPAAITGATWTCVGAGGGTCAAGGPGNINDNTVNLPVGGSVIYTLTGTINASATGSLSNTATVTAPGGVNDPSPVNNFATDTDTLTPQANLSITKTDGQATAIPGSPISYTIVASNAGPSDATGAAVADTVPASITGATWTCVGAGGGTCSAGAPGNINDTVNLPAGGSVTYTLTGTISASATGNLSNTATVTAPGGVTDPNPTDNSDTDTDTVVGLDYFTLAPCRVVDTRGGAPIGGPVMQAQQTRTFAVAGNCAIPSSAKAISINLAVTQPTAAGNLRLFPAGQPVPTVSSINYGAGQTRGNNAVIPLNALGEMAAFVGQATGTTVHLIIDVNGYFDY